jgi:uncharacterized protein YciU (UPF0263 family)
MVIALNAGSNPNGQTPSIGAHGDGHGDKNSLLGNFGDLLTLISVDAENALHENNLTPKLTAEQTSEALLAFAEAGNEDTKFAISTILQRVTSDNRNQLSLTEDSPTSSFLEAKIENRLGQQNSLKPAKILEFFSLADLKVFVNEFVTAEDEIFLETALSSKNVDPVSGYDVSMELSLSKTTGLPNDTSVAKALDLVSRHEGVVSETDGVNFPSLPEDAEKNLKPDTNNIDKDISTNSQIDNQDLTVKDRIILDAVKDILQVNSASLEIGEKGPSEVIFDLRDLKEAIVKKFSIPAENGQGVKVPFELVIPYTLPVSSQNESTEILPVGIVENKFDILEVTKITLDNNLIELPLPDDASDLENTQAEQKSFTVKGGELLLNAAPAFERKLVIGIAVPKNSIVSHLPDFVKIQISSGSGQELSDQTNSNPKINKEHLVANLFKLPKGQLNADKPTRLAKNIEVLITALGEKNNDLLDDTHIVAVNKFSKFSQQSVPNLARIEPSLVEAPLDNFTTRQLSDLSGIIEKSDTRGFDDQRASSNVSDRLSAIITAGLSSILDTKKQTFGIRDTTSVLALGSNPAFLVNNKDLWRSVPKEKFTVSSDQHDITSDTSAKSIFEMLNSKNVSDKFFDPAEIKKIFQSSHNIATAALTGDKLINQPVSGGERHVPTNNLPPSPSLVENKISLYEAQYASRLGMAVVERARAGQENFDIHLNPESFGKIKVNVNLDFRAMDVKIFTETLAAAAIFKDHENILQQIMEQNGMKLASFSVGSQNSNDQQKQFANQNKDRTIGKVAGRGNKDLIASDMLENSKDEPSGLNLIA